MEAIDHAAMLHFSCFPTGDLDIQTDLSALNTFPRVSNTEILARKKPHLVARTFCKMTASRNQQHTVKHFFEFVVYTYSHSGVASENSGIIAIHGDTKSSESSETQTFKLLQIFHCLGKSQI